MSSTEVVRSGPLRYATAERFARPRPVTAGDTGPVSGRICPQPPSRLEAVMGPPHDEDRWPQGEDCLHLSVTAPAGGGGPRPVMVWFHGGGFSSGAGLLDWYDGGALAAEGEVVVVCVNYRLGALGYLVLDGVSEGNLGLFDQMEALRWVRDHIAEYGGDPENVTVFGQSAGALSIRVLLEVPEARGLFHRAVLQSAPLDFACRPAAEARETGRLFAGHLGADPLTTPAEAVVTAQRRTAAAHSAHTGSGLAPAFTPVSGADPLREPGACFDAGARGLDVLYGWNRDEMSAFPPDAGDDGDVADRTRRAFEVPYADLRARLRRAGARVHGYRLDWRPHGSRLGATHCVELPLLLGSEDAWKGAPMLGDADWAEVDALGRAVRAVWASFARTGDPGPLPAPLVPLP
jgi:para-nitrobenzyl esterase